MKAQTINIRGTQMNKVQFSEIEFLFEEKGFNTNEAFNMLADENEYVYVSNGFIRGLESNENDSGEWHHFFKKEQDGNFIAGKYKFN